MALTLKTATTDIGVIKAKSLKRRSIALPARVTPAGRVLTATGDELAQQQIATALGDGENSNPWRQERTVGQAMIFAPNDPQVRAAILRRLITAFEDFERQKRYRLLQDTIVWQSGAEELSLTFDYLDLEAEEIKTFSKTFKSED